MADNTRLVTFSGQNVTPQDDALLYEKAVGENGIIYGADLSVSGANAIHIDSGFGIICGRFFEISDSDINVPLSGSGTIGGRVIAHLDLSNTDEPLSILAQTGEFGTLIQEEDVNIYNGTFEILLATFNVDSMSISNFTDVKPMVSGGFSKEFIANSQTVTEEGLALDARQANENVSGTLANTIMNALKSQVGNSYKGTILNFGIDANGNYGYIKAGADAVTPFRNPQGNAVASDVLKGKVFANVSSDSVTGTMETLTASNFAGSHSSTTAGAASNYVVKASKDGYVANGTQVNSMAAGTAPTIATTAATGTVTFNVKPGYYNKIPVNQTNAYNANGKVTVCTNKSFTLGHNGTNTLGTANLTGCKYVLARFKLGDGGYGYDTLFFSAGGTTVFFQIVSIGQGATLNNNDASDSAPKYANVFVPITGANNMAVTLKKQNYQGQARSLKVTCEYCYGVK